MTAQGRPRAIFRRSLERGNLTLAEVTAREAGRLDLRDAPLPDERVAWLTLTRLPDIVPLATRR